MKKFFYIATLFLLGFQATGQNISVSDLLDGSFNDTIWSNAQKPTKNILFNEDKFAYYLGIKTQNNSMVTVLIRVDSVILVLHSSLSVGQAVYKQQANGTYTLASSFNKNETSWFYSEQNISKNKEKLLSGTFENYGWVASTMNMGNTGETEFIINKRKFNGSICISVLFDENRAVQKFPSNALILDTKWLEFGFLLGNLPHMVSFKTDSWINL